MAKQLKPPTNENWGVDGKGRAPSPSITRSAVRRPLNQIICDGCDRRFGDSDRERGTCNDCDKPVPGTP